MMNLFGLVSATIGGICGSSMYNRDMNKSLLLGKDFEPFFKNPKETIEDVKAVIDLKKSEYELQNELQKQLDIKAAENQLAKKEAKLEASEKEATKEIKNKENPESESIEKVEGEVITENKEEK